MLPFPQVDPIAIYSDQLGLLSDLEPIFPVDRAPPEIVADRASSVDTSVVPVDKLVDTTAGQTDREQLVVDREQ